MNKPILSNGTMQFYQEGNSVDGNEEYLTVNVKDAGAGKFFVLETSQWSFDKIEELIELLNKVQKAFWDEANG